MYRVAPSRSEKPRLTKPETRLQVSAGAASASLVLGVVFGMIGIIAMGVSISAGAAVFSVGVAVVFGIVVVAYFAGPQVLTLDWNERRIHCRPHSWSFDALSHARVRSVDGVHAQIVIRTAGEKDVRLKPHLQAETMRVADEINAMLAEDRLSVWIEPLPLDDVTFIPYERTVRATAIASEVPITIICDPTLDRVEIQAGRTRHAVEGVSQLPDPSALLAATLSRVLDLEESDTVPGDVPRARRETR